MPASVNAVEIKARFAGDVAERVGCRRHVEKSTRPAPTLVSKPPILDRPGRDAVFGQPPGESRYVNVIERILPAAAVDHDHHRKWTIAFRNAELAELLRSIAVGDARARRWQRHTAEFGPGQSLGFEVSAG